MEYIVDESEQRKAYTQGYVDGVAVKRLEERIYTSTLLSDFALGTYSQQWTQGYRDSISGVSFSFTPWRLS